MYAKLLGLLLFAYQIILNGSSVTFVNRNSVSLRRQTPSATLPSGYTAFPDVQSAYKVHEKNTTWYEARDLCVAEGAHLAIADTVEKIEHINSLKTKAFKWLHVGFHRSEDTGAWVRVDNGLPVTSIPWLGDNPDGTGDCAGISIYADALVDYQCHWEDEWFVCEIPIRNY